MPYLQLEVIRSYPYATKKMLAKRIGEVYSKIMKADQNRITVSIRELGEGSLWRCGDGEPMPAAIMMCDIRKGRDALIRTELSRELIDMCNEVLGLETGQLNIELPSIAAMKCITSGWEALVRNGLLRRDPFNGSP